MADNAPLSQSEPTVISELRTRFDNIVVQPTKDDVPTVWVTRTDLLDVLRFLRHLSKPLY